MAHQQLIVGRLYGMSRTNEHVYRQLYRHFPNRLAAATTMKLSGVLRLSSLVLLIAGFAPAGRAAGTVIFRDDFNGTKLNSTLWSLGTWKLGRTQLGNAPVVSGGIARLAFDTYGFQGTEIYTNQAFACGNGIEIEARLRTNKLPSGLVSALFTYTYDPVTGFSDESDIEILSKEVNSTKGGDPVLLTTWWDWGGVNSAYQDGVHNWGIDQFLVNLSVSTWHTYVIRWLPTATEWLIDGVKVASSAKAIPNAPAPVRLNFWAPDAGWIAAYDASLRPAKSKSSSVRHYFDVDYVEVRRLP